jgi:hypothetical protein
MQGVANPLQQAQNQAQGPGAAPQGQPGESQMQQVAQQMGVGQ